MSEPHFGDWLHPEDPLFWDPAEFFPRHWAVRTKSGKLEPFRLWDHQRIMAAALKRAYAERKWIAMVKPRKLGSSTFWTGVATQNTIWRQGCYAKIVAQRDEVSAELAMVAKRFYRHCGSPYKPPELVGLKRTIEIPLNDGKLDIGSVGQDDPGRGSSGLQFLVATEICKWRNADSAWSSLLANLDMREDGMVIGESTPLYHGDPLHQLYEHSMLPDSPWISIFIPWTMVEQNAIDPHPGWNPDPMVADYAHKHLLTDAQAYWMAVKGLQDTKGRLDLFRAEYPIDVVDCWLPGGEATFDVDQLQARLKALTDLGTNVIADQKDWVVYEEPQKGKRYALSCDPAGSFAERDLWAVQILNVHDCSQAAEFLGHSNAFAMAKHLADTAKKYNNATIYVESNGVGDAVLSHLLSLGYPYVYFRRDSNKPGFHTNKTSKAQAIGILQELIRDGSLKLNSPRAIKQLANYRGQWDGLNARDVKGGHYDLVAALAVVAWAWREEGGGTKRTAAPTVENYQAAYRNYMEALDRILGSGNNTDRDTPWGRLL